MRRRTFTALILLTVLTAACGGASGGGLGRPAPSPSANVPVEPGRRTEPAPIEQLAVVVRQSLPPQISLNLTVGLPSGCAKYHSARVQREGDTVMVSVLNSFPVGDVVCTAVYGTRDVSVDLGSNFEAGRTYTVRVNDKTTTFRP